MDMVLPDGENANYRCTVRQFAGTLEISTKLFDVFMRERVSAMQQARELGLTAFKKTELTEEQRAVKDEENHDRSVRRAKQKVRWLLKSVQADHLLTLSYRENMQDQNRLKADFQRFIRLVRHRYPNFRYVAVREYQERGALHIHMGVQGRQDVRYLRSCWYRALGSAYDVEGELTPGQIDVSGPNRRWGGARGVSRWKTNKLAGYMTKYLEKGFEVGEHHSKRYWAPKGLDKPVVKQYWLKAQSLVEMLHQTLELAEFCGAKEFTAKDTYQSRSGNLFWLSVDRWPKVELPDILSKYRPGEVEDMHDVLRIMGDYVPGMD